MSDDLLSKYRDEFKSKENSDFIDDALTTLHKICGLKLQESETKIIATALYELYKSFQVFSPYRDARKVSIFGSARTQESDVDYQMTMDFADKITKKGFMVITGAGGGIMEAGNRGADVNKSFGVNIELPFEQSTNKWIASDPKLVSYKYFFLRKLTFIRESDATVLFPGGYGTHDEAFENLTLIQNGRCAPRPIVLLGNLESDYWESWIKFVSKDLLEGRYISPDDMSLFTLSKDVDHAVRAICNFYRIYHSVRYIGDLTYMRLNEPLTEDTLEIVRSEFSDICKSGGFEQKENTPEDGVDYPEKSRLVFPFNKVNFGRLCELIRTINMQGIARD